MNNSDIKEINIDLEKRCFNFSSEFNHDNLSTSESLLTITENGNIKCASGDSKYINDLQFTPKIISFYTDDDNYVKCSQNFLASLKKLGITNFHIEKISSSGNWEKNCNYKSEFIHRCLNTFKEPVLWVDIDATLEDFPIVPSCADFAIHLWDGWEFASGTVFFNYTDRALKLVEHWCELSKLKPLLWDQMLLDEAWNFVSKNNSLITYWLSERYIHIFDISTATDPIVKHFQESRNTNKFKKPIISDDIIKSRKIRKPSHYIFDIDKNLVDVNSHSNINVTLNYKDLLSYLLSIRGKKHFKFIQVGAMDGKRFDPIYKYINSSDIVEGILLEPNKEMFNQLINNYNNQGNLIFINSAIDLTDGKRILYRIPQKHVQSGVIPEWALGISSFYNDRNAIGGAKVDDEMFKLIKSIRVEEYVDCISFNTLLTNYRFDYLDLLQIDTEGHDWNVLSSFPINIIKPLIINFEYYNMPISEQTLALEWLDNNGYFWSRDHKDVTATLLRLNKNA